MPTPPPCHPRRRGLSSRGLSSSSSATGACAWPCSQTFAAPVLLKMLQSKEDSVYASTWATSVNLYRLHMPGSGCTLNDLAPCR